MSTTARHLRNEADYLPDDLGELLRVRSEVMAMGHTRRTADGLCTWLLAKACGEPDTTAANTRTKYRKILADLEGRPHNRPGSGRPDDDSPIIPAARVTSGVAGIIAEEVALERRAAAARKARRIGRQFRA